MRDCAALLLAAGLGTRMKSKTVKVMHRIAGLPMVCYPAKAAVKLKLSPVVTVVGHQADQVKQALRDFLPKADLRFALQKEQLGTGHAVRMAKKQLMDFDGDLLILYGDVPLLSVETVHAFRKKHEKSGAIASVLTMVPDDPTGYGRMVLDEDHNVERIVEHRDATPSERQIDEVNSGIYLVDCKTLFSALAKLKTDNEQGEYYLTDAIGLLAKKHKVAAILTDEPMELTGINTRSDLAMVTSVLQAMICEYWMEHGVTLIDPASTYIDSQVIIGADTEIGANVCLKGKTKIGSDTVIETGSHIQDSQIKSQVRVLPYSVIDQAKISKGCQIGPFARIRPGTEVGKDCRIGNFVELKKVKTGSNTKVGHLTYLGDADLGSDINIGAGTITCNYDGVNKYKTIIENGAFIGSDSQLIAPVRIGKRAYIGSGSSITEDVPADALALARGRQFVRKGYAKRFSKKKKA